MDDIRAMEEKTKNDLDTVSIYIHVCHITLYS